MTPLYLVDASIYIFRSYFSIPSTFFAANGQLVNAVYGYTNFLLDLLGREDRPEYISAAFDESLVSCFRNRIYPDYKANRELPDENLEFQLAQCQRVTRLLGLHSLCLEDYEADDIIGTLMTQFGEGRRVIIVTRDKDLGQLLRAEDRLWDYAADAWSGPAEVEAKFGVAPNRIADFLALAGDAIDNIPGAPGIGPKTAAALLGHFGSLDEMLGRIDEIETLPIRGAKKAAATVRAYADQLRIYREVTGIHLEVPMTVSLDDLRLGAPDEAALATFCDDMGFGNRVRDRVAGLASGGS